MPELRRYDRGRGTGWVGRTDCAKTVTPLLVTANVKQARKWEVLEKTYKNNNVRAYCEVKDHGKGGCGWHLEHVRGRAGNSPWAALAKLSLFGGSSSGPHDRPRCGPAYRHTESVQSRWELRKEGPKSQTVPNACQQGSEKGELESCLKHLSEWWSRSGKFLCKKTKWTFFLMFQIILYRILKEKRPPRRDPSQAALAKWGEQTRCPEYKAGWTLFLPRISTVRGSACWVILGDGESRAGKSASGPAWYSTHSESTLQILPP